MATQTEVPMDDSELDALMAQLEAETSGAVIAPVITSTPAMVAALSTPVVEEDELANLQAELDASEKLTEAVALAKKVKEAATKAFPEAAAKVAEELTPEVLEEAKQRVIAKEEPVAKPVADLVPEEPTSSDYTIAPKKKAPSLQFYLDVDSFKKDISVSENNLDNAMMQQAGLFAYHAAEAARAEAQYARVKLRFDVVEARLYDRHRKALAAAGEKVTEKMVENAVKMDADFLAAKNLVIEAEMLAAFNKGAVEALKHRKDMIVQLGADRREETKGQTRISVADASHANVKDRALAAVG